MPFLGHSDPCQKKIPASSRGSGGAFLEICRGLGRSSSSRRESRSTSSRSLIGEFHSSVIFRSEEIRYWIFSFSLMSCHTTTIPRSPYSILPMTLMTRSSYLKSCHTRLISRIPDDKRCFPLHNHLRSRWKWRRGWRAPLVLARFHLSSMSSNVRWPSTANYSRIRIQPFLEKTVTRNWLDTSRWRQLKSNHFLHLHGLLLGTSLRSTAGIGWQLTRWLLSSTSSFPTWLGYSVMSRHIGNHSSVLCSVINYLTKLV